MRKCFVNYDALTQVRFIHPSTNPPRAPALARHGAQCWEDRVPGESCGETGEARDSGLPPPTGRPPPRPPLGQVMRAMRKASV